MRALKTFFTIGVFSTILMLINPTYALNNPVPYYAIITTNEILLNSSQLESFVAMKTHQGFRVKVVTENDFDNLTGQPPNGRAEKIRKWLINNYLELNIRYVLLIGDPDPDDPTDPTDKVGDIPMKMCWKNFSKHDLREDPTDFFYADLDSDWNADGDDFFGERHASDTPESPMPGTINIDQFWARWEGKLKCDSSGDYKISTFSDGGVLVKIDESLVICDECLSYPPVEHYPELADSNVYLDEGFHDIEIIYTERYGDALMQLLWTPPDIDPSIRKIIPKENLWHQSSAADISLGLKGSYYNGFGNTDPKLTRVDETINFVWATGDIQEGLFLDPVSEVYVGRIPVYANDPDRFTVLDSILEKIIDYETDSRDISWRRSMLLPFKLVPSYAVKIAEEIAAPNNYLYKTIYDYFASSPTLGNLPIPDIWYCSPENVVNEWKNGYGMAIWAAHGAPRRVPDVITIDYLQELDDNRPSFTIHGSCNSGWPEDPMNLAYSLLMKKEVICSDGGLCYISPKRGGAILSIAGGRPTVLSIEQLQYPFTIPNIVYNGMPAGMALSEGKAMSSPETFNYPGHLDPNDIQFNLYGDPNTHLQKTFPMRYVESPICGDVNCNGLVNDVDYAKMDPRAFGQICKKWSADVNCDGAITIADTETLLKHLENGEPLNCCADPSVFIKREMYNARVHISNLSDKVFKNNPDARKKAINNKFLAVHELVDTGYYEDAYNKIEYDIRCKFDGSRKNVWIIDPYEQERICSMLDSIKGNLLDICD